MKGLAKYEVMIDDVTKEKRVKKIGTDKSILVINIKKYIQETIQLNQQTLHANIVLGERLLFIKENRLWLNYYPSFSAFLKIFNKDNVYKVIKTYFVINRLLKYPDEIFFKLGYYKCERIARLYPKHTKMIHGLIKSALVENLPYREIRNRVTTIRTKREQHHMNIVCNYCGERLDKFVSPIALSKIYDIIESENRLHKRPRGTSPKMKNTEIKTKSNSNKIG